MGKFNFLITGKNRPGRPDPRLKDYNQQKKQ
jgi:hypothetical protein